MGKTNSIKKEYNLKLYFTKLSHLDHTITAAADQLHVVGDHQDGFPFVCLVSQHIGNNPHVPAVQSTRWLIKNEHITPGEDSAGQGEALLLSAGKGGRMGIFIRI